METAEHEFLETLGSCVVLEQEEGHISWPRVAASCEYRSPARFGDILQIHLRVLRKGRKSMTYGFTFSCRGTLVARGRMSSVCCVMNDPGGLKAIAIPPSIADRIAEPPEIA